MKNMSAILSLCFVALTMVVGCSETVRSDIPQVPAEIQYAEHVRAMVQALKGGRGDNAGVATVSELVENMAAYESEPMGEHKETYQQIYEGAQELQTLVDQRASQKEIRSRVDALIALTEKLPKEEPKGGESGGSRQ